MKVKISSWKDLKVGDVWLGLEVEEEFSSGVTFRRADRDPIMGCAAMDVSSFPIDVLVHAGNDEVERRPKKVEFTCEVYECTHGTTVVNLPWNSGFKKGQTVKVTIEPA